MWQRSLGRRCLDAENGSRTDSIQLQLLRGNFPPGVILQIGQKLFGSFQSPSILMQKRNIRIRFNCILKLTSVFCLVWSYPRQKQTRWPNWKWKLLTIKIISAEHSSNYGKNKVTKKPSRHGKMLSRLSLHADPVRENWTWLSIFQ